MDKKLKKIICLVILSCFLMFTKNVYANTSINISGATSAAPGAKVNISVGGNFTGRVNVSVSNGDGSTNVWIENNTVTIPVTVGSSGSTVVNVTPSNGMSDANGNEISVSANSKTIAITTPKPVENNSNNNNNNNGSSTNGNSNNTQQNTPVVNNNTNNTNSTNNKNTNTNTQNTNTQNTNTNKNTKNSNTYLSKLQVNKEGLTPNFNKEKTSYSLNVNENVTNIDVTAIPEASTSKVSITGNTNLKNGDNTIYITVTAENGAKKTYTITVTKSGDPVKSNSYLESLIVENATLSPAFSKEVFEYDCGVVGKSIESLKILAFGENENVKIEITGNDSLIEGENEIKVKVTSEDGTTTKEYIIKVKKDSSIVEEEKIEEINLLEDLDNNKKDKSIFKNIIDKIRNNALIIIMEIMIIVEFIEIVYLYRRQDKSKNKEKIKYNSNIGDKTDGENISNETKLTDDFNVDTKPKRKRARNMDD